jgi:hypothetical protein
MARSDIGTSFPCSQTASQTPRSSAQSAAASHTLVAFQSDGMRSA